MSNVAARVYELELGCDSFSFQQAQGGAAIPRAPYVASVTRFLASDFRFGCSVIGSWGPGGRPRGWERDAGGENVCAYVPMFFGSV